MQTLTPDFFAEMIAKAVEWLAPSRIILFGSFARGDVHEKSDIDVAFEFEGHEENWILFKDWTRNHMGTLREWDLVDLKEAEASIVESVEREGRVLYEA